MFEDFKKFILRGNVLDLAIGIIIGGAFGRIVTSLVNDVIMPPIGLILGQVNFTDLFLTIKGIPYSTLADAQKNGAVTINYGVFINTIIEFLIVALVIFLLIRWFNRLMPTKKAEAPAAPTTKECPYCLSTIHVKATRCPNCTSEVTS
jgi:large conductance mechanosensitive channel